MDFNFTDEQQQFRDALRRYLDNEYGFEARQTIVAFAGGRRCEHWQAFTELGLTALPVPEAQGGFDGGPGRHADRHAGARARARRRALLGDGGGHRGVAARRLARPWRGRVRCSSAWREGAIRLAVAFHEPHARYDLFDLRTTARARRHCIRAYDGTQVDRASTARRPITGSCRRGSTARSRSSSVARDARERRRHGLPDDRRTARRHARLSRHTRRASAVRKRAHKLALDRRGNVRSRSPITRRCSCARKRSARSTRCNERNRRVHEDSPAVRARRSRAFRRCSIGWSRC